MRRGGLRIRVLLEPGKGLCWLICTIRLQGVWDDGLGFGAIAMNVQ